MSDSWWHDCALWGQLNLQEHDPSGIDVDKWKDYWRRTHIDGVTLNASGIIHYYPTDEPHAWISPWLDERDLLGELVTAARELDLRVLARFTPSRVHEEFALSHPDWLIADVDGQPRPDPGHDPGQSRRMYHTCLNGPHYRWWVPEVMFGELMRRYDVDGFFFNAWQTPERDFGACHCRHCRAKFAEDLGRELPARRDTADPAWIDWLAWHGECMVDLGRQYQTAAKALKPSATSVLNLGGDLEGMHHSGDWRAMGQSHDMIDHDHQSRHGPIWSIGMTGRLMRAAMWPKTPYYHLFGVYGGQGRIAAQPAAEHTLMMAEMIASGSRLWYHIIGALGEDRRPFDTVERMYDFYHRNREYFVDADSAAELAVVFSHDAVLTHGGDDAARRCGDPYRGACHALVRGRMPFDMLSVDDLGTERMDRYRALILPNQAYLSDEDCDALRAFVERGGGLVSTGETSLHGSDGARRDDFALGDVLGVQATSDVPYGPYRQAYIRLEEHDVLGRGLEGTDAVSATVEMSFVPVTVADDARVHLSFIPPIPHMPPERAYFHVPRTDTALAVGREHGRGRSLYFPCDVARWCAVGNNPDHRQLMLDAVDWVLREPLAVEVEGDGLVDVFAYRQPGMLIVHMVNCTNPDNWTPPAVEISPIGAQTVTLRGVGKVSAGRLLWADRELSAAEIVAESDRTVVAVDRIDAYEVLVLDIG